MTRFIKTTAGWGFVLGIFILAGLLVVATGGIVIGVWDGTEIVPVQLVHATTLLMVLTAISGITFVTLDLTGH